MFLKYMLLGVFQLFLLIFVVPLVVGVFAGLLARLTALEKRWHIAVGMVVLLNIAVLIDKGFPFFTGHVVDAFMYYPLTGLQQFLVGLIGDALLVVTYQNSLKRGIQSGLRIINRDRTPSTGASA